MPSGYTVYTYDRMPNYDRILAPVPIQVQPGYVGLVSRIDGTLGKGTWNCSCADSFGPPFGLKK